MGTKINKAEALFLGIDQDGGSSYKCTVLDYENDNEKIGYLQFFAKRGRRGYIAWTVCLSLDQEELTSEMLIPYDNFDKIVVGFLDETMQLIKETELDVVVKEEEERPVPKILEGKVTKVDGTEGNNEEYTCEITAVNEETELYKDMYLTFHALDAEGERVSWSVAQKFVDLESTKPMDLIVLGGDFAKIVAVFSHGPVYAIEESACVVFEK